MNQIGQKRRIINRLAVEEELQSKIGDGVYDSSMRPKILSVLKVALIEGKAEVQRRFEVAGANTNFGSEVMSGNTFLVDQLVRILFDVATNRAYPVANKSTSEKLCIVAVGGYGRSELAPFSDVDLMFLIPYKETPYSEQIIEKTLKKNKGYSADDNDSLNKLFNIENSE